MKCYLAHPVIFYGTYRQRQLISFLGDQGLDVVNPDTPEHHDRYLVEGMPYFERLVGACDILAFSTYFLHELERFCFPPVIGAGVAKEIIAAQRAGMPVYDISHSSMLNFQSLACAIVLDVDGTRALNSSLRDWQAANRI